METWSIEPYDDRYVTDNGNGNYVFNPANFPEGQTAITFTITYTDGDISGSMEYVVKTTDCYVNPCSTKLTPPKVSPPKVEDFSSDGGDINAEWDDDTCWELITAATTNNATAATLTNPSIISVAANNSPTEVTSVVTYKFKNTVANVTGQSKVTITQKTNPCYTSETPPTVTFDNGYSATTVAAMGTDASRTAAVLIGTDECWRLESYQFISPTPDEHATFNNDGSSILVNTNQTDAEITVMAKYHFVNVVNSSITGDREIKISQPAGCGCGSITNYRVISSTIEPTATSADICQFNLVSTCDISKVGFALDNNSDGVVKVNSNSPKIISTGNESYKVTAQTNTNDTASIKSFTYHLTYNNVSCEGLTGKTTQGEGCACTCRDIVKVLTEEKVPFYTYTPDAQTNVPFAILTTSTSFNCDITPNKKDNNITSIACTEYSASGNWNEKMKTYCNGLVSQGKKVFIIYGSLTAIPDGGGPRALGFTYSVCNNECKDTGNKPFYVYQRCACGMDNCRTEYTAEGQVISIEDRPLYISSCHHEWSNGDSIFVTYLEVTGAALFNLNSNREKEGAAIKSYTLSTPVWLRDDTQTQLPSCSGAYDPDVRFNCKFDADSWSTSVNAEGEHVWGASLGYDAILCSKITFGDVPIEVFLLSNHGTEIVDGVSRHCGMAQYVVKNAAKDSTKERLIEIYYRTHGGKITGGPDSGKCASETFTVSIMVAPKNKGYRGDDSLGLRNLSGCCYCTEGLVVSNLVANQNIPASKDGEYVELCRFKINKTCLPDSWVAYLDGPQFISISSVDSDYYEDTNEVVVSGVVWANNTGADRSETFQLIINDENCGGTFTITQKG